MIGNIMRHGADFQSTNVIAAAVTLDSVVWVGTDKGISRFDGQTWMTYTTENGLVSHQIHCVHTREDGVLCVGTDRGISCLNDNDWMSYVFQN